MASEAGLSPKRAIALASAAAIARFSLEWPLVSSGVYAISDDDFARVTIAQRWVVAPTLDPSETSWLPAQFWLLGFVGRLFGRSWECMQNASVMLGMLAAAYLAWELCAFAPKGHTAALAVGAALLSAWGVWCGACTVPEAYTGLLSTAALVALTRDRFPWHAAVALLVAGLSRYETWPVLALVALLGRAWKRGPWAYGALLAPVGWMLWNRVSHGDSLYFLARVATYREAHAAQEASSGLHFPASALEGMLWLGPALPALALSWRMGAVKQRQLSLSLGLGALCTVLFLAYGDARGGAPTHHAARALVGVWASMSVWSTAAVCMLVAQWPSGGAASSEVTGAVTRPRPRAPTGAIAVLGGAAICMHSAQQLRELYTEVPPGEPRAGVFARGRALRAQPWVLLRPCAYEHYALAAAYGAPEHVRVLPAAPLGAECPQVLKGTSMHEQQGQALR